MTDVATRVARSQEISSKVQYVFQKRVSIAQEHFRGQGRHGADTGMRHEPPGLRTRVRLRPDSLIEVGDLCREVVVQCL